jgi:uncharacterized membrane protein (DUF2068 family)
MPSDQRPVSAGVRPEESGVGLRLIVGYKVVKSAAELLAGVSLLLLPAGDAQAALRDLLTELGRHATEAWSHDLAGLLTSTTTPSHLGLIATALVLDGLTSAVEGWTLQHRYRWGRWLVIFATSAFLPFEVFALFRRFSPSRIVILLVNASVVVYLVIRKTSEGQRNVASGGEA